MADVFGSYQSLFFSLVVLVFLLIVLVELFKLFQQAWIFYKQSLYKKEIEWSVLELKIPRVVEKTPLAMEQFLKNIHGLRNAPGDFMETYVEGEVTLWWSLEIVSFGGKIHFYIRTPKKHKKMVEAGLYAQYQSLEVTEVDDYLNKFPSTTKEFYKSNENIFGSELPLKKEDFYPIATYEQFAANKEELAIDPISALIEVLANIQPEENVFIQILAAPAGDEWRKAGEDFINKKLGKEDKKKKSGFGGVLNEFFKNLFMAPAEPPVWGEEKKEEKKEGKELTPADKELIEAIRKKLSQPGFDTLVRFLYIAPNAIYSTNFARRGIRGALNQYASPILNSFGNNSQVETRTTWVYFPYVRIPQRVEARKQRLLYNFRNRLFPEQIPFGKFFTSHIYNFNNKSKSSILVASELATIYHIPAEQVLTSPHIERAESKKMGPPAGLPIFEEE